MREPGYDPLDIRTFSDLNALHITLTVSEGHVICSISASIFIYRLDNWRKTFYPTG